jgi:uridine kinase
MFLSRFITKPYFCKWAKTLKYGIVIQQSFLISVTGPTASGKSFFSKILCRKITEDLDIGVTVFKQDNYYKPIGNQPRDENNEPNFDLPESLDLFSYTADLKRLLSGETLKQEVYNYNNPTKRSNNKEFELINPNPIIIAEGIYTFHEYTKIISDISVFLDVDPEIQYARRLKRDTIERGYDKADVDYKFENHIYQTYKEYLLPIKDKHDYIFNNSRKVSEHSSDINELYTFIGQIVLKIKTLLKLWIDYHETSNILRRRMWRDRGELYIYKDTRYRAFHRRGSAPKETRFHQIPRTGWSKERNSWIATCHPLP